MHKRNSRYTGIRLKGVAIQLSHTHTYSDARTRDGCGPWVRSASRTRRGRARASVMTVERAVADARGAHTRVPGALLARVCAVRAAIIVGRLSGHEAEGAVVHAAEAVEEEEQEDGAREEVEDAVPDHLARGACNASRVSMGQISCDRDGRRTDDVGALRAGPGDGVDEPDHGEEAGTAGVRRAQTRAAEERRGAGVCEQQPTAEVQ